MHGKATTTGDNPAVSRECALAKQSRCARRHVRRWLPARCSQAIRRTIARALPKAISRVKPGTIRPPGPSAKITQGARPLY